MQYGPLQNPLQSDGLLRNTICSGRERLDMAEKVLIQQLFEYDRITATRAQNLQAAIFKEKSIQDMLRRKKFVPAALRFANSQRKGDLNISVKHCYLENFGFEN
jgi:hypothetical protein